MKIKQILLIVVILIPLSICANHDDKRCINQESDQFKYGNGSFSDPFLICNLSQFARLSNEEELLQYYYTLGNDLSFKNINFPIIGSESKPFTGGFNGNYHTLSDIKLTTKKSTKYIGPFAHTNGAQLRNIFLNHVLLEHVPSNIVGGLVAFAENTTLINVHAKHIDIKAPDSSGGLIGILKNSLLVFSSAEGILRQHFGTDGSGGLIGKAERSRVFRSESNVDLVTTSKNPFGVSFIGGLSGVVIQSIFTDVSARGNINYQFAENKGPRFVGGLFGGVIDSVIIRAYYAGHVHIKSEVIGGAIAINHNSSIDRVFWDKELSGILESDGGIGEETAPLKTVIFWEKQHFNPNTWHLLEGDYPTLNFDVLKPNVTLSRYL